MDTPEGPLTRDHLIGLARETPFPLQVIEAAYKRAYRAGLPCDVAAMQGYCRTATGLAPRGPHLHGWLLDTIEALAKANRPSLTTLQRYEREALYDALGTKGDALALVLTGLRHYRKLAEDISEALGEIEGADGARRLLLDEIERIEKGTSQ